MLLAALLLAPPAWAQDGSAIFAQEGGALFARRCASCHSVAMDAPPMAGPNLRGVFGRRVAGDPRFDYSPALRRARDAGDAWDDERLMRYLDDPEEAYPGSWMGANGLPEEDERRAVAAFLRGPE